MASIQERTNGRWAIRWRDPDGRQRWRTFQTESDARAFCRTVEANQASDPQGVVHPTITVAAFSDEWRSRQLWKPSTVRQVDCYLSRYILPSFGSRPLASVRHGEVQAWVRQLSELLSATTVNVITGHLRSLFNEACRDRIISDSPVRHVRLPRARRAEPMIPTVEQVRQLRTGLPAPLRLSVDLAAGAGLRLGEVLGLTLDRVDRERATIRVDRQLGHPGTGETFQTPKTLRSFRTIPVPSQMVEAVHAHMTEHGTGPHGLLLSLDGRPVQHRLFAKRIGPVAQAVGLPPRTGLHCLRHFYASLLIRSGLSVKVVQARLGHATAGQTLDTYAHLWPDDEDRTRQAVAAFWR